MHTKRFIVVTVLVAGLMFGEVFVTGLLSGVAFAQGQGGQAGGKKPGAPAQPAQGGQAGQPGGGAGAGAETPLPEPPARTLKEEADTLEAEIVALKQEIANDASIEETRVRGELAKIRADFEAAKTKKEAALAAVKEANNKRLAALRRQVSDLQGTYDSASAAPAPATTPTPPSGGGEGR